MKALTVKPNYPPGDLAIWIYILAERLVFTLFKGLLIGDYYMGLKDVHGFMALGHHYLAGRTRQHD